MAYAKKTLLCRRASIIVRGLVKKIYFLLSLTAADAAGDEPERKTDKTDLNNRKKFNDGL
jgi:hypothetical protein